MVWFGPKVMKDFPHVVDFVSCQFQREEDIRFLWEISSIYSAFAVALFSSN